MRRELLNSELKRTLWWWGPFTILIFRLLTQRRMKAFCVVWLFEQMSFRNYWMMLLCKATEQHWGTVSFVISHWKQLRKGKMRNHLPFRIWVLSRTIWLFLGITFLNSKPIHHPALRTWDVSMGWYQQNHPPMILHGWSNSFWCLGIERWFKKPQRRIRWSFWLLYEYWDFIKGEKQQWTTTKSHSLGIK